MRDTQKRDASHEHQHQACSAHERATSLPPHGGEKIFSRNACRMQTAINIPMPVDRSNDCIVDHVIINNEHARTKCLFAVENVEGWGIRLPIRSGKDR